MTEAKTKKLTKKAAKGVAHINARRWFDKQNTYHSVSVSLADGTVLLEAFEYGYGDAYLQTAARLMGWELCDLFYSNREKLGITVDCADVPRRRDLHNAGKR